VLKLWLIVPHVNLQSFTPFRRGEIGGGTRIPSDFAAAIFSVFSKGTLLDFINNWCPVSVVSYVDSKYKQLYKF